MPTVITTDRIILRTWRPEDLDEMAAINDDSRVMRYFPSRRTRQETLTFLEQQNQQFAERNHAYFAAERITDGRLLGFVGLSHQSYEAPFTPCVDIGWRLHPDAWGKGYATEGALACLQFAREELKLKKVVAVTPHSNLPSVAVMRRIGMKEAGLFDHPGISGESPLNPCVWWSIEW
ncbi:GNAT family N-acetyltransferase [Lewinella sp. W8]|uniref:GNAT family N-acetyltransferase n=1 Tax=Lewinella sp. W8 TaxID=2528208 RepID=UPI0010673D48|nr:GNAT family N-acetyltransferase [Lewinella sp. W8]MTB50786.1 GNAT family N-acetyltransferase [Lewinella sp. W8]